MNTMMKSTVVYIFLSLKIWILSAEVFTAYLNIDTFDTNIPQPLDQDIFDTNNVALVARYIVHNSNWTSVSYISHSKVTLGLPFATLFSVSDGPIELGSGVPYFYVSRLQAAVTDLMDNDHHCSLMMSMAQSYVCNEKNLDPEDPRCAHIILSGTFHKINNDSNEFPKAEKAIFTRHSTFRNLPKSHSFFLAKLNIEHIVVQNTFGGPSIVPVADYFNVHSHKYNLHAAYSKYFNAKIF